MIQASGYDPDAPQTKPAPPAPGVGPGAIPPPDAGILLDEAFGGEPGQPVMTQAPAAASLVQAGRRAAHVRAGGGPASPGYSHEFGDLSAASGSTRACSDHGAWMFNGVPM